ncbi:MAG: HigA family addiction module antidote protein [Alphaproteobacteria bacterium]|nr:HigA family addiction module antidote protein [Alphaproteobacteria bacterium]
MSKSSTTTRKPKLVLPPIHPGEILADELKEIGVSANGLARALDVPTNRITEILAGKRGITADTASRLARYFGTGAQFWLNLQQAHDLLCVERDLGPHLDRVVRRRAA